jgi:hypothetical protein
MIEWRAQRVDSRPPGLLPSPYFEWARATNYVYYGDADWLPVLIELRDTPTLRGTAQAFAEHVFDLQALDEHERGWAAELRIPRFYRSPSARLRHPLSFLAVLARKAFLERIYSGCPPFDSIRRFEIGRATPPSCVDPMELTACKPSVVRVTPLPPRPVVTGVIDDGIAFAHDRFFSTDGTTRIEFFWDQQTPSSIWGWWGYGSEISKRVSGIGIDDRLIASTHGALVDEDEVYRLSGHLDHARPGHKPLAARASHGAHVMDLACNRPGPVVPPPRPAAATRPIVAVQLPVATVADTSGATLEPQIFNGLCYIIDRADAIADLYGSAPLPVVVNVSYGTIAGPHDGSGLLESAMDALLKSCNPPGSQPSIRVVLPAGNSHLSRCHACLSVRAKQSRELAWRVVPDDWTESHVDIWLPAGTDLATLALSITAPDNVTSTGPLVPGLIWNLCTGANLVVGQACCYLPNPGGRTLVRLALAPTGWPDGGLPLAPAGVWRIKVDNSKGKKAVNRIHAWIQRDDTAPGYRRRGRQSHFDDPADRRYDDGGRAIEVDGSASYVKRQGTLNAIATGREPVVIGGFSRGDRTAAPYSASGPLLPPQRGAPNPTGPDAMLPSDDAASHRGVLAAGTRSNSCVAAYGTSVAAPQAAFGLAEWMASGLPDRRAAMFDAAVQQELLNQDPKRPTPAPSRGGGGRIPTVSNRRPR